MVFHRMLGPGQSPFHGASPRVTIVTRQTTGMDMMSLKLYMDGTMFLIFLGQFGAHNGGIV